MNRPALEALRDSMRLGTPVSPFAVCVLLDALLAPDAPRDALISGLPTGHVHRDDSGGTWITCSACGETMAAIAWPPHRYGHDQAAMWHRMAVDQHVAGLTNWSA